MHQSCPYNCNRRKMIQGHAGSLQVSSGADEHLKPRLIELLIRVDPGHARPIRFFPSTGRSSLKRSQGHFETSRLRDIRPFERGGCISFSELVVMPNTPHRQLAPYHTKGSSEGGHTDHTLSVPYHCQDANSNHL